MNKENNFMGGVYFSKLKDLILMAEVQLLISK